MRLSLIILTFSFFYAHTLMHTRARAQYILVKESHPQVPLQTKSCSMSAHNSHNTIRWNEDIVLNAPLSSIISNSSLLLLEILDTRTPLNNSKFGTGRIILIHNMT